MKPKTCPVCRSKFEPFKPLQKCCGWECAHNYVVKQREKEERIQALKDRKTIKAKLDSLKTTREVLKEAQAVFNAFIRERDKDKPCISCGRFHKGAWDAGHYRSVGAAPALRFDEANCHRQCVPCNQHKSGNVIEYRLGLVERIGIAEVERLEGQLPEVKWTKQAAKDIKDKYAAKLKYIKKG